MKAHYVFGIPHVETKFSTAPGFAGTYGQENRTGSETYVTTPPADNLMTGRSGLLSLDFHFVDHLPDVGHAVGDLFDG